MHGIKKVMLAILMAALLATSAFAQDEPPASFSEYASDFSDSDLSMQLVEGIFGPVWSTMLSGGGITIGAEGSGRLLGQISLVLNASALALTGFLIVMTVFTSVLSTGNEGVTLGKKYSTLWVPVRICMALLFLIPVAGGYSLGQAGVMLVGKAGAGVANTVFEYAYDYVSIDAGIVVEPQINGVAKLASNMLKSQVCMSTMNATRSGIVQMDTTGTAGDGGALSVRFNSGDYSFGHDICGAYIVRKAPQERSYVGRGAGMAGSFIGGNQDINEAAATMEDAQWSALVALSDALVPVSQSLANGEAPNAATYRQAVKQYRTDLTTAAQAMVQSAREKSSSTVGDNGQVTGRGTILEEGSKQIKELGWAASGAFYWTMTALYSEVNNAITEVPTGSGPNVARIRGSGTPDFEDTLAAIIRAGEFSRREGLISLYDKSSDMDSALTLADTTAEGGDVNDALNELFSKSWSRESLPIMVSDQIMSGGDPIMSGKKIGHALVASAEVLYTASIAGRAIASGVSGSLIRYVPFVGGFSKAVEAILDALSPLIFTIFMSLLILGLLLAYWLPAIPLLLWIFGMLGWLIMLVEAVFAAVIWVAAHAIPEGDGWAGTHARSGYMLILGLFMRPPLMVAGMFSAMLIMSAAGRLIGVLYPIILVGADITSLLGVAGFVASMAILTTLLVVSADRSFSLIHVVPDKVLRWVSGPMENLGESEDNNRTRLMMAGVMGRFEGMARGGAKPGMGSADVPAADAGGDAPESADSATRGKGKGSAGDYI